MLSGPWPQELSAGKTPTGGWAPEHQKAFCLLGLQETIKFLEELYLIIFRTCQKVLGASSVLP